MQFETDYIITWDISDKDFPIIKIGKLSAKESHLFMTILYTTKEQSGVVSLRQISDKEEAEKALKGG